MKYSSEIPLKAVNIYSEGNQPKENIFRLILSIFIIIVGLFFFYNQFFGSKSIISPKFRANPLENIVQNALTDTQGTYAIVITDLKSAENYNLNEHKVFQAGSLYKLWIMATAFKQIEDGKLKEDLLLTEDINSLNKKFNIDPKLTEQTKGKISLTVKDALHQMIVISHNYAALLLTDKIKLSSAKQFIEETGLNDSKVGNDTTGPVTSAFDTALFLEKLYKGELGSEENTKKMVALLKEQQLNDKIPKYLPQGTLVAHKTGEIDWASHDGAVVFTSFGDYLIVVLSESNSPTKANDQIAQISKKVYDYFAQKSSYE